MKNLKPDTEIESLYSNLEKMGTLELLTNINAEDFKIAEVVKQQIPTIEKLVDAIVPKMKNGGRLFYIGAGTSGRIGVLDASECPPTLVFPMRWSSELLQEETLPSVKRSKMQKTMQTKHGTI